MRRIFNMAREPVLYATHCFPVTTRSSHTHTRPTCREHCATKNLFACAGNTPTVDFVLGERGGGISLSRHRNRTLSPTTGLAPSGTTKLAAYHGVESLRTQILGSMLPPVSCLCSLCALLACVHALTPSSHARKKRGAITYVLHTPVQLHISTFPNTRFSSTTGPLEEAMLPIDCFLAGCKHLLHREVCMCSGGVKALPRYPCSKERPN